MIHGEFQFSDTANIFLVATDAAGERVVLCPTGGAVSRAEALNMAAWIVALVDPEQKDFKRLLETIGNT